jgi:alpha-glucosidase (family GH31 glycosyl hydrolase)
MRRSSALLLLLLAACSDGGADATAADVAADGSADTATDTADAAGSADTVTDAETDGATDGSGSGEPCPVATAPAPEPPPITTPRWAFEPWISKDISTGDDSRAFVQGFKSRDIPVGVLVIDSPWETHYNTFVPNPTRYPGFADMVADLRAEQVRTVLWITQMVNQSSFDAETGGDTYRGASPGFDLGLRCGLFVNEGERYFWWKGRGAALDFFNPAALAWWHSLQDPVLDMGIAGFKTDFGDEYITDNLLRTAAGEVTKQAYSEAYYRDLYAYGASRLGREEFVIMTRPYDRSYGFEGRFFARPEHAPVGWVGDNRRDWIGLSDALDHIFRSAAAGYVVLGSDVGGYLDRDDLNLTEEIPFDEDNFLVWTAVGALSPFMELHGRANLEPWNTGADPEHTVEVYRFWSRFHMALRDHLYTASLAAYAGGQNLVVPVGEPERWAFDYRYLFAGTFLVAPYLDGSGVRDVLLPAGSDWFSPFNLGAPAEAGNTLLRSVDVGFPDRIPVYLRGGAVMPLLEPYASQVWGLPATGATHTWLAIATADGSGALRDESGLDSSLDISVATDAVTATLSGSSATIRLLLRIRDGALPQSVELGGAPLREVADAAAAGSETGLWYRDPDHAGLVVLLPASADSRTLRVALAFR